MIRIEGFDALTRELDEAQRAIEEIDGDIGEVRFDPSDPAGIEEAIAEMERMIDTRVGRFSGNAIVAPVIAGLKESYRHAIVAKAAEARIQGDASR